MYRAFSKRNLKEFLRDPLSYIFCLIFPIVMLILMTLINSAIPPEANMTVFNINCLSPGICVFGLSFIMLFGAISVSKDRGSAFIIRLYASPLTPLGFILGYTLPLFIVAICQCVITFLASVIIGAFTGYSFNIFRILLAVLGFIPSVFLFIGLGILFGTVFSDKSAPPLCSIIISASSVLGGVFMDIGAMGGIWEKVCSLLPFYPAVTLGRKIINGEFEGLGYSILLTVVYAVVIFSLSVLIFKSKMKRDLK